MAGSLADSRLRRQIIEAGRRLCDRGLVVAAQGNLSVRTARGLLVTASGVSKGALTPRLILDTDPDGRGSRARVSSEVQMHAAIYRLRPDVQAIVHAHPPVATAFSVTGHAPDPALLAETVLVLGRIPLVPYEAPSTPRLAETVGQAMVGAQVVLLANHGAVSVGVTMNEAMNRMETLEHLARVTLLARVLGKPRRLSGGEVQQLLDLTTGPYR